MKQKLRFWLGMLFSAAGLFLAIRATDLAQAWSALAQTDYLPLLPALAALAVTILCKAVRWRLLFDARYECPPLSKVFSVLVIGQMVNLVLPLRFGEIARAYYLGEMVGTNKSLAMSTVVVEKLVDMLAVLLLVIALLFSMNLPSWLQEPVLSLATFSVILLALLFVLAHQRAHLSTLIARLLGMLPDALKPGFLRKQAEASLDGLRVLRQARTMLPVMALTLAAWISAALTNQFVFLATGISLPFTASLFVLVVLQVGVAVPAGPGRVGVFQYLIILALSLFSVAPDKAFATGVVLYLLVNIPLICLGLVFLWQYHLSLWRPQPLSEES